MDAIVIYESMYGNTRAIAEAVAAGLGGAAVVAVADAPAPSAAVTLTVVGGPTHMHGVASRRSRWMAASAVKGGAAAVAPAAADGAGLRGWLGAVRPRRGAYAAALDPRLPGHSALTGAASRAIARRLRRRGYRVLGSESFCVSRSEGPLLAGELDRARRWGAALAQRLDAP